MAVRRFVLQRHEDVSGVSGVGTVAEGVEFSDGTVALRWITGDHHSTVLWNDLRSVEVIHGHDGRTTIEFLDSDAEATPPVTRYRDAGTGEYVTKGYAERNPGTTVAAEEDA